MRDAFDSDVLIYACAPEHPLGRRVRALFTTKEPDQLAGVGSLLLLPEVLAKPMRQGATTEVTELVGLLGRLELRGVDPVTAEIAASLASQYRLKAADAVHLATAVVADVDRFITNNRKDFPMSISEVDVVYPDML